MIVENLDMMLSHLLEQIKIQNVLINRGWIKKDLKTIQASILRICRREIIGLLREIYKPNIFKPDNDLKNNIWFSINLEDLKVVTGQAI